MRPIGYWLKHLDRLIERQFEATVADLGLTRRGWQVLNVLADGGDPATELAQFDGVGPELDRLRDRGWVAAGAVTEPGREVLREAGSRVAATRETLTAGLTREDYETTVRVLSVMAANVEAALSVGNLPLDGPSLEEQRVAEVVRDPA